MGLTLDRFFHCTNMDTGSTKQMEDICRQQSYHHLRRNSFINMKTCAISIQSCWSGLKMIWTYISFNIHTMVEGTTMAYTGAIQLAYNRGQYSHRTPGIEKCACCTSTTSSRHHTNIFKAKQTHQICCILQKIHQQLQALQGQANHHSAHTKPWTCSDLLCKDGTTNFLYTRNERLDGTSRICIYQFS